jgi:hypothetical protein
VRAATKKKKGEDAFASDWPTKFFPPLFVGDERARLGRAALAEKYFASVAAPKVCRLLARIWAFEVWNRSRMPLVRIVAPGELGGTRARATGIFCPSSRRRRLILAPARPHVS